MILRVAVVRFAGPDGEDPTMNLRHLYNLRIRPVVALSALILIGCRTPTPSNTVTQPTDGAGNVRETDFTGKKTELLIGDTGLIRDLAIERALVRTLPTGLPQAQLDLMNRTRYNINFEYQFEWFDAAGFRLDTPASSWSGDVVPGTASRHIQAVGPAPEAKLFKVRVRRAVGGRN